MDTFLKNKKINSLIVAFLIIISLFFVVKIINEVKSNMYIGVNIQNPNIIYVSGKGKVKAIPDIASITINLSKEATTAKEAQNLLNKSITKTIDYLKKTIENKDIKSEYGGLTPKYSFNQVACISYPCPPRNRKIVGYTASQTIVVKIRDLDNANNIRTNLTNLGVTNINGPTFTIDDNSVYLAEARDLAIKDARSKAIILAKDLGVKLGKIMNFTDNSNNPRPIMYSNAMASDSLAKSASAPQLPKGESTITSNVTITYQIR